MKKHILITIIPLMAVLASCPADGGGDKVVKFTFTSPPPGVYIAGYVSGKSGALQACYWTGNDRIFFDGYRIDSISVSDGTVLIIGTDDKGKTHYWVDGTRYDEIINVDNRNVIISGGKIYKFEPPHLWVDGVEIKDAYWYDSSYFHASDIAVFNGEIYLTGIYNPPRFEEEEAGYFVESGDISEGRWKWGIWHTIVANTGEFTFIPQAITIGGGGTVYVVGTDSGYFSFSSKAWYYTEGNFYELEEFDKIKSIKRIAASDGKLYVFPNPNRFRGRPYEYWVDGKKVIAAGTEEGFSISTPVGSTEGFRVDDVTVSGGRIYMAGQYIRPPAWTACYWVDGEMFYLDGSAATAIYVAE